MTPVRPVVHHDRGLDRGSGSSGHRECRHGTRGASGMELPDAASGPRHRTRARAAGRLEELDDRPVLKCQLHD